ncbi:glycosyltransferase family 4 protein [Microbacterium sp. H1-D42]|uniref:glycosyltransferase family 4 protein n=1 Tax=Microbacterium sp. H1-D42 TaxID=2925844 RepID=UPI001F52C2D1|nr:glycosyltransferase family 4 protein [Microbacterium sp. H1-D42]UNK70116.1 glycosyltransferase family 4 protein [Microbacterium sp. H1-D42]
MVQPSMSHYREPLVRELLGQDTFEYELIGRINRSAGEVGPTPKGASTELTSRVSELRRRELVRALFWDSGLVMRVFRTDARAVVLEGNIYGVSNWIAVPVARMRKMKVIFWGHGWKRPESGMKLRVRRLFYQLADGHLTYGDWAREYAAQVGLNSSVFFPVYNSIYRQTDLETMATRAGREDRGCISLVYSGRLTPRHRVDQAIELVKKMSDDGASVRLKIIGDGQERQRLEEMASGYAEIEFLGAAYDRSFLESAYSDADFAISPGATGLNVIQALGFGVPVIAASGDPQSGPELEAVRNGETGVRYMREDGIEGLMRAVNHASNLTDAQYAAMSVAGQTLAIDKYSAEAHASAITDGLRRLVER